MSLIVYLMFNGDCEEALTHYTNATGGSIEFLQRFSDTEMPVEEGVKSKVMHARAQIHGTLVLASDTDGKSNVQLGDNIQLSLDFHDRDEITRVFNAIAEGGTVTMPLQDTFWNAHFGMCTDRYGVKWMFNYDYPGPESHN